LLYGSSQKEKEHSRHEKKGQKAAAKERGEKRFD